jgi:ribosomal protein S27AE
MAKYFLFFLFLCIPLTMFVGLIRIWILDAKEDKEQAKLEETLIENRKCAKCGYPELLPYTVRNGLLNHKRILKKYEKVCNKCGTNNTYIG